MHYFVHDQKVNGLHGPGPHFFALASQSKEQAQDEVCAIYGRRESDLDDLRLFCSEHFSTSPDSASLEEVDMPLPVLEDSPETFADEVLHEETLEIEREIAAEEELGSEENGDR
jgi:hypothetical protein